MKAINLICSIGAKNISHKAVKDFSLERNFSDVCNKFSMTLIDSPGTSTTDLELYMNAGYRKISVSYTDTGSFSDYSQFKGQIWDYQCTFVGDIKQLQITGYLTRAKDYDYAGQATYNIDWNNYYNMRKDESKFWNVVQQSMWVSDYEAVLYTASNSQTADLVNKNSKSIYKKFRDLGDANSLFVAIKGPSGKSIKLGIPEVFTAMKLTVDSREQDDDGSFLPGEIIQGDDQDPKGKFWGVLNKNESKDRTVTNPVTGLEYKYSPKISFWVEDQSQTSSGGIIRAFQYDGDTPYIQLPGKNDYFGGGQLLYNPNGVDPSSIVRKLAILEGWDIGNIVQTEYVPCSDKFKMQGKTALDFINEVLVPVSITPIGTYTDTSNNKINVSSGESGFVAYFKNNKFYYEPLDNKETRDLTNASVYRFGYNIPNSPVISFQVETKGTAFYTNPVQINALTLTGKQVSNVVVADEALIDEYNKVKGHQENLDAFFGYTYEEINKKYANLIKNYNSNYSLYLPQNVYSFIKYGDSLPATDSKGNAITSNNSTSLSNSGTVSNTGILTSDLIQKGLVTNYPLSSDDSKVVNALIKDAYTKIKDFTVTAVMNIWGDIRLSPNSNIYVLNMVKSQNSNLPEEHPSSGTYRILSQTDTISDGQFTQQLKLMRNDKIASNINTNKIDWSKQVDESFMYIKLNHTSNGYYLMPFDEKGKRRCTDVYGDANVPYTKYNSN